MPLNHDHEWHERCRLDYKEAEKEALHERKASQKSSENI